MTAREESEERKDQPEEGQREDEREREALRGRAEWFRRQRIYPGGEISADALMRALQQKERLRRSAQEGKEAPVWPVPPEQASENPDTAHCHTEAAAKIRVRQVENPQPRSSFGFASDFFAVEADGSFRQAALSIPVDVNLVKENEIDPATLRLFRWDGERQRFRLVRASGINPRGQQVSARISRQGIYAAIGLSANPWVRETVAIFSRTCRWQRAGRQLGDAIQDRTCWVILCPGPEFQEVIRDPQKLADLGLPAYPRGYGGNVCEHCTGLQLGDDGCLPEGDIIREQGERCHAWESFGPRNINGRVRALAIHPVDGHTVYAGSGNGGVWVTHSAGLPFTAWSPLMRDEPSLSIGALAVHLTDPTNPAGDVTIYAGTGEPLPATALAAYPGVGVLKSTDSGSNWRMTGRLPTAGGTPPKGIAAIVVDPTAPRTVYVAAHEGGLFKSVDGGETWMLLRPGDYRSLVMDPSDPRILYAGQSRTAGQNWGRVLKTTDAGATWTQLTNGLPSMPWLVQLAVCAARPEVVYAKLDEAVYKSTDHGATWTNLGNHGGDTQFDWCSHIEVDPTNPDIVYAGGIDLERSLDGGNRWTTMPRGTEADWEVGRLHPDQHALVFDPSDPSILYAANDGGVYRSANRGDAWAKQSDNLVITEFYDVGIGPGAPVLVGGGTQDQGTLKTTGSQYWTRIFGGDGGHFVADPTDPNILYFEAQRLKLRKSVDGGATSTPAVNGITEPIPTRPFVGVLAIDPTSPIANPVNNRILYTGTNRVYKTTDGAANWRPVTPVLPARVSAIAIVPSARNVVYVGTEVGTIYRTTDGGATWSANLALASGLPGRWVRRLAADRTNPDIVYAVLSGYSFNFNPPTPGHVFRSQDGGATWERIDEVSPATALPDVPVNGIEIDQNDPDILYVATDVGVFRTTNRGLTWAPFDDGLPNCVVNDLVLDLDENALWAGTFGRGMYRRQL